MGRRKKRRRKRGELLGKSKRMIRGKGEEWTGRRGRKRKKKE